MVCGTVSVEEITLQCTDGMQLAAQRWSQKMGQSNKAVADRHRILCLHGFIDNCRSFHHLAPFLVSEMANAELVALDFPGHGLSSHKSSDHPPMMIRSDLAYYIAEAVRALQWEEAGFTLIGHSMGAILSIVYTATFPEQVQKLFLLDGYGPDSDPPDNFTERIRQHVVQRYQGNAQKTDKVQRVYQNMDAAVETRLRTARNCPGNQWLSKKAGWEMVHRAVVQSVAAYDNDDDGGGGGVRFLHDPRLQWPPLLLHTIEQVDDYWREIQCPTYWLRAEYGWPYPKEHLDRAESLLLGGSAHIQTLPGSHHFHADPETADQVARTILKYI